MKLVNQRFDAGLCFALSDSDDRVILNATRSMTAFEVLFLFLSLTFFRSCESCQNVWLVDHAWTTSPESALQQLIEHPGSMC